MNARKYRELRKKRLKEREERFRREKERIENQEKALKWRIRAREEGRRRTLLESHEKEEVEREKQEKAREAIVGVKAAIDEVEKKAKASLYAPEMTQKISEMLTDADESFDSADYERSVQLCREIEGWVERARTKASQKAVEEKRRRGKEAKYLYCMIPAGKARGFGNIGLEKNEVYTIPYRDVAAVVSDSPMKDYELSEDNLMGHEAVLRQVMEEHTVVPVEFGTTIRNERILRSLVARAYNPIRECLRLVDNKVELGVKAVLNEDIVFADQEKREECLSDLLASLKTVARQAVTGDLFSDRLLLNTSFLVDKEDVDAFSEKVTELQQKYSMLKLLYSGPWPPYNFIYIKIGAQGLEVSNRR